MYPALVRQILHRHHRIDSNLPAGAPEPPDREDGIRGLGAIDPVARVLCGELRVVCFEELIALSERFLVLVEELLVAVEASLLFSEEPVFLAYGVEKVTVEGGRGDPGDDEALDLEGLDGVEVLDF